MQQPQLAHQFVGLLRGRRSTTTARKDGPVLAGSIGKSGGKGLSLSKRRVFSSRALLRHEGEVCCERAVSGQRSTAGSEESSSVHAEIRGSTPVSRFISGYQVSFLAGRGRFRTTDESSANIAKRS
ncbi:MAG: hypothetical protein ACLR8Y_09150 [Alistipes indistinctus]